MRIKKKDRKAAKRQRRAAHSQATFDGLENMITPRSIPHSASDSAGDYLAQLDGWLEGDDEGTAPADVLRERGLVFGDDAALDDVAVHRELWRLIEALSSIGVYLSSTDHLSDRELYRTLIAELLPVRTMLRPDDPAFGDHWDPIGGCSNEDIEIYLTYYADDGEREGFMEDGSLPERRPRPYDRDKDLPTQEGRFLAAKAN